MEPTDMPMHGGSTISLSEDQLPEVADWKVGQKYTVTLELEQTAARKTGGGKVEGDFRVLSAESETPEEEKTEGGKEEADTENASEDTGENETPMKGKMGMMVSIKKVPANRIANIVRRKFAKGM